MLASDVAVALQLDSLNASSAFSCISTVSRYLMEHGSDTVALDAIIRLRDYSQRSEIDHPVLKDAIYALCREVGLFPYLPLEELSWRDRFASEIFRGPVELNYIFHKEQWLAFQHLLNGKSLVLSAPTSFGKSVLIHAFIAKVKPRCVVIVVPTLALLDQFRRRLTEYFGSDYHIITRNDQTPDPTEKRIFVVTQERLLERDDIAEIDLLAIDEYYKLDSGRDREGESGRTALLNVALRRYMAVSKQIFFLGPTVAGIEMREDIRTQFEHHTTDFSTVAVDVHDCSNSDNPYQKISALLLEYNTDKSLIFSKSPPAARKLATEIASRNPRGATEGVDGLAEWLAEAYHPEWSLVAALKAGYGLHHGAIPRSVAQLLTRFFNDGDLDTLICTSTLIEGVNTSAKNVFIFDKKINNSNFDYFDFRNIAGRSGRMGHHYVGRIFLFHDAPIVKSFQLDIPALGEDAKLSDAVLINLSAENLSTVGALRRQELFSKSSLPEELLKRMAPYGLVGVENLSDAIRLSLVSGDEQLLWRGHVGYPEMLAVFSIAWRHLKFNKGHMTERGAAFFANRLRGSSSLRDFFDGLVEGKEGSERTEAIEKGFRALVAFDYAIPKVLVDIEELVNFHCGELGLDSVDYSYMAQCLDNCFCHHWVKALDEYGIPLPLGKRLSYLVENAESLDEAVRNIRAFVDGDKVGELFSYFELGLIRIALS